MIDIAGMDAEELEALFDGLAIHGRNVVFARGRVLTAQGAFGTIISGPPGGPMLRGRAIAVVGSGYTVPGETQGNECCPHLATGTLEEGAQDIVFQGTPVVFVGHGGTHWPTCQGKRARAVACEGHRAPYWVGKSFTF